MLSKTIVKPFEMRKIMKHQFTFCLLFSVSTLLISCDPKEDSTKETPNSIAKSDSVLNFFEMSALVKKIIDNKGKTSFLEDNDLKKLEELQKSLNNLAILAEAMKIKAKSAPIEFDTAVLLRQKFKDNFGSLANIFPQSFAFEMGEMKMLISKAAPENTIIRMYLVFDDREFEYRDPITGNTAPKKYKYSFAFIAANPLTADKQENYKKGAYVLDVLDPCPPPTGCQELKTDGPTEPQQ